MTLSIHDHSYEDEDFWDEEMEDYLVDEVDDDEDGFLEEDDIYDDLED